ncbi:helix-turn-helix transcriptional regulator [Muricauda brasiliensis]|uniref:helix-turn-helix transcriptional regulator n=1 Tax=Muricauda brasiliensis TaxID=2162892 RepID=UPI001F23E330|nr:LuxR C-terminal-related transcriptional regulator [Muricauda brasiliensis]
MANEIFSLDSIRSEKDSVSKGLTSLEWKKFKKFEAILQASDLTRSEKEYQLTGYARDSLRILEVKLVAIKVLDEKNLLNRDIAENPSYYSGLLKKLKASEIAPSEYLFLEEKLTYINQEAVMKKLKWSTWLNAGLLVLIVILAYLFLRQKNGQSNPILPELSKQETLVRNLIIQGKSNKEIATELFISLSTVKSHITNIYSKLNVANRQELLKNSTGAST